MHTSWQDKVVDELSGDSLLKTMKDRLAFLDGKLTELKPLEAEATRLRAAIIAYEQAGKPAYRGDR